MMGSALGGCDTFHSRFTLGMGWMLWVVSSLVTTLRFCLARIPSTCGLYWQPSWSMVTGSVGVDFYAAAYSADKCHIVVSGKIDPALDGLFEKHFGAKYW